MFQTFLQLVISIVIIGTVIWVARDAERLMGDIDAAKRKQLKWWTPAEWAIGCFLLWIVVFPVYLFKRSKYRQVRSELLAEESKQRRAA